MSLTVLGRLGCAVPTIRTCIICTLVLITGLAGPVQAASDPLVLGVFPRRNATLTTRFFTPIADYLSRSLGREVKLETAKDFSAFWLGVKEQRFDIVHYNQFHYISSSDAYEVIAHNEEFGKATVAGALYVRKDSGIDKVEQLRGKQVVFGGGEDAMMSYILPSYLLLQAGLKPGDYTARFAPSPPNGLLALYYGQGDASGAGDILIDLPMIKRNIDTSELRFLRVTEPLLHLPWAVKRSMELHERELIQSLLVGLNQTIAGKDILKKAELTGIGAAKDSDYDPHRRIISAVMQSPDGDS